MAFKTTGVLATAILALALAGCQSERFSRVDTRGPSPAPLQAAPAGSVTAGQLPPPVQPGTTDPSQFPVAPGVDPNAPQASTQVAAAAPSGPAITTGSVAGVWNASVGGQSCRIATPQTRFGQGFRAGPLRCPAPLDGVKSWNVSGSQLALYNDNGEILARLSSTGGERFDGQTSSGQQVSLSR
jgi:hypothetical protein